MEMNPEEAERLYKLSVYRAARALIPFLIVAGLLGYVTRLMPNEPRGYYAVALCSSVITLFAGMITFIVLRRCPRCACRSPTLKGSRCCRRCGIRLTSW